MEVIWSPVVDAILGTGRSLTASGVRNWALTKAQALIAVKSLAAAGIGILGGDVYEQTSSGTIQLAYANWHADPRANESSREFVTRSAEIATSYIFAFPETGDNAPLFTVVPRIP